MSDIEALPTPEVVQDLADGCVKYVEQATGVELDFTQDTLPVLDHYLERVPEEAGEEVLALVIPMCGAYFGEVVRRHMPDGRWHVAGEQYERWRVEFNACFLHFNPIGMVLEALMRDDAAGWAAHLSVLEDQREALKQALERLGEVEEDDYYRLAVRFEVIEQAHEQLSAWNREQTKPDAQTQSFGPDVYAAQVDRADELN